MFLFAKNRDTGEVFEVLNIELFQGFVDYMEIMDCSGSISSVEDGSNYDFHIKENEGGE